MCKKILSICFSLALSVSLYAQEKMVLRTDRDYYIGGEDLWLNIINLKDGSNTYSDLSQVAYVEIINSHFRPVLQKKLRLNGGSVTSVLTLPDTISTGNYAIRVYTRWMRNGLQDAFTYKTISVINPFSKNPLPEREKVEQQSMPDSLEKAWNPERGNGPLTISTNSMVYRKRDRVHITVEEPAREQNLKHLTVAVVKNSLLYDSLYHPADLTSADMELRNEMAVTEEVFPHGAELLLPELKGEWITGTITDITTGEPVSEEKMVLSFVGNEPVMKFSTTDGRGRFQFEVNEYGDREMVIQPMHLDTSNVVYKVTLDPSFSEDYPTSGPEALVVSKAKARALNQAIVNMQVNTIYSAYKEDVELKDSVTARSPFYGEAEITVPISKYIDLPSVEEVVRELLPYTVLRKLKGNYYFKIFETKSYMPREGSTLTMVDGVPVHHINNVLAIRPDQLRRVEVINLNYYLQDENLGRLLCFYSVNGDMGGMDFDPRLFRQARECYHPSYTYRIPDYTDPEIKKSRLADFRNSLYFGEHELQEGQVLELNCYTGDDVGEYRIVVSGLDKEGRVHTSSVTFEVR